MTMTVQEIAKSYREAKHKYSQIQILADLNNCSREQIIVVLKGQGITDIPEPRRKEEPIVEENAVIEEKPIEPVELVTPEEPVDQPPAKAHIRKSRKKQYSSELETDEKLEALFNEGLAALDNRIAYYEHKLAKARAKKEKLLQIKEMED